MRIPPLLADFIYNRGCELKCEKFLTRPNPAIGQLYHEGRMLHHQRMDDLILETIHMSSLLLLCKKSSHLTTC